MTDQAQPAASYAPEGYVYVIKFSSGRVKVGFTADLKGRLANHATYAKVHGVRIEEKWATPFHKEARFNEKKLIGFCRSIAGVESAGEYFTGLAFGDVVAFATSSLTVTRTTAAASKRQRDKATERAKRARLLDIYEESVRLGQERVTAALRDAELELAPLANQMLSDPVANAVLERLHDGEQVSREEIWSALRKYARTDRPQF